MDYEQFLKLVFSDEIPTETRPTKQQNKRTADEIMAELMPLVEADRKKGG